MRLRGAALSSLAAAPAAAAPPDAPPPPLAVIDRNCVAALLFLLFAGVVALYSMSFIAKADFSRAHFYRHCVYIAGAGLLFAAALQVPLRVWQKRLPWVILLTLLLCVLAVLSSPSQGASRWISVFGLTLQPAEFLKFTALLTYAWWGRLTVENNALGSVKLSQVSRPMIPIGVFVVAVVALLALQRDLGTIVLLSASALVALLLAGIAWRYVTIAVLLMAALIGASVLSEGYRVRRFVSFIDPFSDPYGAGFNQLQSLMAYVNGGWLGEGPGGSLKKELLPEGHNDFIIAVIAEEYGLIGFFALCAAYLWVAARAINISRRANGRGELFGAFYAFTFAVLLLSQVAVHVGGSLAVLPSKGLTLPLVSYGGSSLWATALMLAVLLRLDYENKCAKESPA